MGPHSFERGDKDNQWGSIPNVKTSMGPHSFERGDSRMGMVRGTQPGDFNGAALFRARRYGPDTGARSGARPLQWGRTLSSAEMLFSLAAVFVLNILQWGRTLSSAEIRRKRRHTTSTDRLQWGRTLSSAEIHVHPARGQRAGNASMGPHSFERGDEIK